MENVIVIPEDATKEELIAMLRDPYPLPGVSIFPLARCWYILFACIIAFSLFAFWRYKSKRLRIRRKAINELNTIYERYGVHKSPRFALGLSVILRKVAIVSAGRQNVANLYGDDWIDFLTETDIIPRDIGEFVAYIPYAPSEYKADLAYSNSDIIKTVKKWVIKNT